MNQARAQPLERQSSARPDVVLEVARGISASPSLVNEAVLASATTKHVRKVLLEHLARHRDALHSGASNAPPSLSRLVVELRRRGVAGLRAPACAACGREMNLKYRVGTGRMCLRCFRHHTAEPCARCGKTFPVATRTADGEALCGTCHTVLVECSVCGRLGRVAMRTPSRAPICARCAPRPERVCTACGRQAPVHSTNGPGPLCDRCYTKPPRQCGICGQVGSITLRALGDGVDVCDRCYARPVPPCPDCGERRDCGHDLPPSTASSLPEQDSASRIRRLRTLRSRLAPERDCALCHQVTKVHANWPLGGVCVSCYSRHVAAPSHCTACGRNAVLIGTRDGQASCGPCAGVTLDYRCRSCETAGLPYRDGLCPRCCLQRRLAEILGPPSNSNSLEPLRSWLTDDINPRSTISWLSRANRSEVLRDLASREALDHDDLDGFARTPAMDYLRALLTHVGVLPRRNEPLERTVGWLDDQLRQVPKPHRRLVRPFGEWVLLRRARRRARHNKFSEGSARYLRSRVTAAFRFLDWLDNRSVLFSDVTQHDVDRYLAQGPTTRYLVRDFLVWASKVGEAPPVSVPERRQLSAVEPFDEEARSLHLRNAIDGGELDLASRVAAVFVLLYGQHLSRVVTWRTDRISEHDGHTTFRFDQVDVPLVEPFAAMIRELVGDGYPIPASARTARWIFPGGLPGEHARPGHLARKLASHGIHLRRARNTALAELAADLPAPVLADLLGMHIHTAVAWVKSMQRDWYGFVAAARDADSPAETTRNG